MRPAAALEQFLERLFERTPARVFRARIQPVQIQRRVERAMEMERREVGNRIEVPSRFTVHLNPADLAATPPTVAVDLADAALAFAHRHGYRLAARPIVRLAPDPRVDAGDLRVRAWYRDPDAGEPPEAPARSAPPPSARPRAVSPQAPPPRPISPAPVPSTRGAQTIALPEPPRAAIAVLVIQPSDGTVASRLALDGSPLGIGRAADNDLVLGDGRVSRHHARIQGRGGVLVLTDLDSTNGTFVNGYRAREVVLGEGDRIQLGATVLAVERAPGGPWTGP